MSIFTNLYITEEVKPIRNLKKDENVLSKVWQGLVTDQLKFNEFTAAVNSSEEAKMKIPGITKQQARPYKIHSNCLKNRFFNGMVVDVHFHSNQYFKPLFKSLHQFAIRIVHPDENFQNLCEKANAYCQEKKGSEEDADNSALGVVAGGQMNSAQESMPIESSGDLLIPLMNEREDNEKLDELREISSQQKDLIQKQEEVIQSLHAQIKKMEEEIQNLQKKSKTKAGPYANIKRRWVALMQKKGYKVMDAHKEMCQHYNIESVTKCLERNQLSLFRLQDEILRSPPKTRKLIRKTGK